jgi:hypothetical protein
MTRPVSDLLYDHVWFWRRYLGERKNQPCRRVCQGRNGNVLVEFDDGDRVVAPRYAIRKAL